MMLGPHPGVPIDIKQAKGSPLTWLLVQRHPVHGWDDYLWHCDSLKEAEAKRAQFMAGPTWNAAAERATDSTS